MKNKLLGKMKLNDLIEAAVNHLRDNTTDVEEIYDLLGYITGTKIFGSDGEGEGETIIVWDEGDYVEGSGMIDGMLTPDALCICRCGYKSAESDFIVLENGKDMGDRKCPSCGLPEPTIAGI